MKNNIKIDKDLKNILIIGANGFLGTYLLQFRNKKKNKDQNIFIAADIRKTNIEQDIPFYHIDITNPMDTTEKIIKISPDVIILTAAMTDVDQCEVDKKLAIKLNTEGPKNLINACEKSGCKLIFMSTDFVFDGTKKKAIMLRKIFLILSLIMQKQNMRQK